MDSQHEYIMPPPMSIASTKDKMYCGEVRSWGGGGGGHSRHLGAHRLICTSKAQSDPLRDKEQESGRWASSGSGVN